jgi:tetratricopeptide (TPR) repeat protein
MEYAQIATARATARSANRDALRAFELGLDAARRGEGDPALLPLELNLRIMTLGAMLALGRSDEMVANLERAEVIAKQIGDVRRQAAVQLQLSVILWTSGSYRRGIEAADHASASAAAAGSRSLQMAAAQAHMMQQHALGRYVEVATEARNIEACFAPELAQRQMMKGWGVIAAVSVKVFLADALARTGDFESARTALGAGYREIERQDHAFSRIILDHIQGLILTEQGNYPEAVALLRAALRSCEINDVPTMHPPVIFALGGALARDGKAGEAIAMVERAIADKVIRYGGRYNEYYAPANLGIALAAAGRYDEAIAEVAKARAVAVAYELAGYEIEALSGLAEIEFLAGRREAALSHFEEAWAMASARSMARVRDRAAAMIRQITGQQLTRAANCVAMIDNVSGTSGIAKSA